MRELITAGHSYEIIHSGLHQKFVIAMEKLDSGKINITGPYLEWVLKKNYIEMRDCFARLLDAEDMNAVETIKKEMIVLFTEHEND